MSQKSSPPEPSAEPEPAKYGKRVPFSVEEKNYLIAGVEKSVSLICRVSSIRLRQCVPIVMRMCTNMCTGRFGKGRWREIRDAFPFHPKRSNVNLKDKWRNLEKAGEV